MHFFLLFVVVEAEHKMAPNARCANNGQTDDSLITYSAQIDALHTPYRFPLRPGNRIFKVCYGFIMLFK